MKGVILIVKKEIINYLLFLSLIISVVLIFVVFLPLKKMDEIFKKNYGNKIIDKILWVSGKSPI